MISRGSEDIEHEECGDNSCNIGGIDAEMKKRQSENGASTEERGENGKKRAKIRKERRELHSRNEKRAKRIEKASSISMAGRRDNPIQEQLIQHQESPESVDTTSFSFITSESVTQELSWLRTFDSLRDGVREYGVGGDYPINLFHLHVHGHAHSGFADLRHIR